MTIKIQHIDPEFVDKRGGIATILDQNKIRIQSILRITSKAGTVRANHYHKKDYHWIYIEKGACRYYERPADKPKARIKSASMKSGDLVLTEPKMIHAVRFLTDTIFYTFTTERRDQKHYEKDTIRIELIK